MIKTVLLWCAALNVSSCLLRCFCVLLISCCFLFSKTKIIFKFYKLNKNNTKIWIDILKIPDHGVLPVVPRVLVVVGPHVVVGPPASGAADFEVIVPVEKDLGRDSGEKDHGLQNQNHRPLDFQEFFVAFLAVRILRFLEKTRLSPSRSESSSPARSESSSPWFPRIFRRFPRGPNSSFSRGESSPRFLVIFRRFGSRISRGSNTSSPYPGFLLRPLRLGISWLLRPLPLISPICIWSYLIWQISRVSWLLRWPLLIHLLTIWALDTGLVKPPSRISWVLRWPLLIHLLTIWAWGPRADLETRKIVILLCTSY